MRATIEKFAIGAVAVLVGALAFAQDMDEVTVQGTRMVAVKAAGRASTGVPTSAVSLSYNVSFKDLDLASRTGFMEAQKRVKELADRACKELEKLHPDATPTVAECSKTAADKAMVVVNGWADRASKAAAK